MITKDQIQKIIDQMESSEHEACQMLKDLIDEKWEPKGGEWYVATYGDVDHEYSSDKCRKFGIECQTKEQAETLRDMTHRNNLIFQAIREKGYECKRNDGHELYFHKESNKWSIYRTNAPTVPENFIDTRAHAEEVIKMVRLNEL